MASADIKIDLSDDAAEFFMATRVIHCRAFSCKNNAQNFDKKDAACILKRIYIVKDGKCEQFEEKAQK